MSHISQPAIHERRPPPQERPRKRWVQLQQSVIQARSGTAIEVAPRQILRIVDVEGAQVAATIAINAADSTEFLDTTRTRNMLGRSVLKSGDRLFTNRRRPAFVLVRDDVGEHDLAFAACDSRQYASQADLTHHPNCLDNLTEALAPYDLDWWRVPNPVNFFQNTPVGLDGAFAVGSARSRPGDCVELLALMHLAVAVSACPDDVLGLNGCWPTSLAIEIWGIP